MSERVKKSENEHESETAKENSQIARKGKSVKRNKKE